MKITLSMLLLAGGLFNTQQCKAQQAGDIDENWGVSGWVIDNHVGNIGETFHQIKKMSDGRFLAVGQTTSGNYNMLLAMYNNDGTLDGDFGNFGVLNLDFPEGGYDTAHDAVELWDGKILVVGNSMGAQYVETVVIRLHPNGDIDQSFGTSGVFRFNPKRG